MGVQILSKDTSVISTINAIAKASINNVMGATGWAAATTTTTTVAPIVVPSPTPDWPNNSVVGPFVDTSAQIIGTNVPITLNIYFTLSGGNFYVSTNTSNSFPGSVVTPLTSSPTSFTVNPGEYVIFRLANVGGPSQNVVGNVTNVSNGGNLLDTFTITYS